MTCTPSTFTSRYCKLTGLAVGTLLGLLAGAGLYGEDARGKRTDLYGDPLPPGAVVRFGSARLRHAHAELTYSKDGKHLISCDWHGEVRVWDAASGKLLRRQHLARSPVWTLALAPGGVTAAVWARSAVYVLDAETGKERRRLPTEGGNGPSLLTFSPDGKLLAGATLDHKDFQIRIQVWDVAEGTIRRVLKDPGGVDPWIITFSPDAKRLAGVFRPLSGFHESAGDVVLWDVTTGRQIHKKDGKMPGGEAVAFSPDGKTLAVGASYPLKVRLLDAATLKEKVVLRAKDRAIKGLAFSPDGRFLAGAYGGTREGERLEGSGVLLWNLKGAKKPRPLPRVGVRAGFAFTPDGRTLACPSSGGGSEFYLWEVATGRRLLYRPGHATRVKALATSPDGKLIASHASDGLYLWKIATGALLHKLNAGDPEHNAFHFSRDGQWLISTGAEDAVLLWDVATGKELQRFTIHTPQAESVAVQAASLSTNGKRLTAVFSIGQELYRSRYDTSAQVVVWDLTTGKRLKRRPYKLEEHHPKHVKDGWPKWWGTAHAAFTPDGKVVTVWLGDQLGLEAVSTGRQLAVLPKGAGRPIVFSPDGRLVAAAVLARLENHSSKGEEWSGVSLIEAATGGEIVRLAIGMFGRFAFTPDRRGLVGADSKSLHVWDTDTGQRLHQMVWPESLRDARGEVSVTSLAVLPGGRAVTGMEDGEVLVWDLAPGSWPTGKPVRDLDREKLDALWSDLAGDARKAHRALHTLAAAPARALPFFGERLRPAVAVETKRVEKLLANLENKKPATRKAAARELAELRERIGPLLRRTLKDRPSPKTRRHLRAILAGPPLLPAETRRTLRAIAALERIATPESKHQLEKLSGGADAHQTRAARAALERLNRR